MSSDTISFLSALLFVADDPDDEKRPLIDATIGHFSRPFVDGVEGFIDGFLEFLRKKNFDFKKFRLLQREFGSNVFFSLSGHGVGFWDEVSEIGDDLQKYLEEYSGNKYRFEELQHMLDFDGSVIDLSYKPEFLEEYRTKLFKA